MKVRLICDAEGPNPDFRPPDPNKVGQLEFKRYIRRTPHTITVAKGTELPEDANAWIHCLPDASGVNVKNPRLSGDGVVRAVPVDEEALEAVEFHIAGLAPALRDRCMRIIRAALKEAGEPDPYPADFGQPKA